MSQSSPKGEDKNWLKSLTERFIERYKINKATLERAQSEEDYDGFPVPSVADPAARYYPRQERCVHSTITVPLPHGAKLFQCQRCLKQWRTGSTVADHESVIDPVITNLANEMSERLGQTMAQIMEATAGTTMASLPVQAGTTMAAFFVEGDSKPDPELKRQQQESQAQLIYRKKVMEEAARAAAAALDMEERDKTAPIKLDGGRKLKVVS
jgi:hypothetical protein